MSQFSALGASPVGLREAPGRGRSGRRAPRVFGFALLAIGLIIVTIVGVQYLRGTVARERARAEWTKAMKASSISAAISALGLKRVASGTPVVRVMIPSIRLDEVVVEGLSDKDLWAGPGHMPGTVFPGENGNSVISAHRDRHFHRLDDLRVGDMVETQTPTVNVMWRITQRRIVGKDERAIFETASPMLTLTTCWPTRYIGTAPDRLLLTAEPVSMQERATGPKPVEPSAVAR
ncbi:MAG: class D sortase [Gemmatimonadaceae bacterium]|nr:class D sortase [Gemmatimonadaceae bacterium]